MTKVKRLGKAMAARRIYVIDLPKEYAFVAPAVEQFLISYLDPKDNSKDGVQALRERLLAEGRIKRTQLNTPNPANDQLW